MNDDDANKLLERVATNGDTDDTMALLKAFFHGYPVENVLRLLESGNDDSVVSGGFIASELGIDVKPIWKEVAGFLSYPNPRVQGDILDCILLCSTGADEEILGRAVGLIRSSKRGNRWSVINFLSLCDAEQIRGAGRGVDDEFLADRLRWLAEIAENGFNPDEVRLALESGEYLERAFGLIAAIRVAKSDPRLLEEAASIADDEIRDFAGDFRSL